MEELVLTMEDGLFLPDAIKAETERKANEEIRIANEQERKANEEARKANETSRQEKMVELVDTIENKIMFYKKEEYSYTTTAVNEQEINLLGIGMTNVDVIEKTIMFVTVNGIDLIENEDYILEKETINLGPGIGIGGGTPGGEAYTIKIKFTNPITTIGTKVHFVCLKATVASEDDLTLLKGEKGDAGEDGKDGVVDYDLVQQYIDEKVQEAVLDAIGGEY